MQCAQSPTTLDYITSVTLSIYGQSLLQPFLPASAGQMQPEALSIFFFNTVNALTLYLQSPKKKHLL